MIRSYQARRFRFDDIATIENIFRKEKKRIKSLSLKDLMRFSVTSNLFYRNVLQIYVSTMVTHHCTVITSR